MLDSLLHVVDGMTGVSLIPAAVELLGDGTQLDDQVVGKIFRLKLAALLPPKPDEIGFVLAHDHPRIRAADE
jgi:hypothetical protein